MINLPDGLYRVEFKNICAGFVVKNCQITQIAPILVGRIYMWKNITKRIGD